MARPSSRRMIAGIAAVLLVLIAVGLIVWGTIIVFASRQVAAPPRAAGLPGYVQKDNLDVALALRSLAGASDREVVADALANGKLETAFAALAFSASLSDLERVNTLLALAPSYAKETDKAAACFQLLADLAVLSADFNDYQKADLLLQAGDGLQALGKSTEAEEAYDRAQELARYGPALLAANRIRLFKILADRYTALNKLTKTQDALHAAEQPLPPSAVSPVTVALPARSLNGENDAARVTLKTLETERIKAVNDLIAALGNKPSSPPEAKRQAVEKALLAEDEARDKFYTEQSGKAVPLGVRSAAAHARVEWLVLKWRIAAQGFGLSLAPAWETKAKDIQTSLRRAYEDDYTLRLELASLLPDPLAARQATVDVLVDEIKVGHLDLYPSYPERGLASDLTDAIKERIALRDDDALYVVAVTRNGAPTISFAFANADQLLRK